MNTDAMRSAQEEIAEYRRQLQARTTELEALKSTKESLERQRSELEDRHQADIASYQVSRGEGDSVAFLEQDSGLWSDITFFFCCVTWRVICLSDLFPLWREKKKTSKNLCFAEL